LPLTSDNGIQGTWSPDVIDTSVAGIFDFTFTPDPDEECAMPVTISITISQEIEPIFAQIGPICEEATIPELPLVSTNGITGTWSPAIDNTQTTTYTFTPADGQCAIQTQITIEIIPAVELTITIVADNNPVCAGTPVTFTATALNAGTGAIYSWFVNGNLVQQGISAQYSYIPANNDLIYAEVTSLLACVSGSPAASEIITMVVHSAPDFLVYDQDICAPGTIDLTAPEVTFGSDPTLTFEYYTDAQATQVLGNPSAIAVTGTYYIKAVGEFDCPAVKPVTVTIHPAPPAPVVTVTQPDCSQSGSILVETPAGTGYAYSIDGINFTSDPHFRNVSPGTYTVTVKTTNDCSSSTVVTIEEYEIITLTETISHVLCIDDRNGKISLEITGGDEPYSILWSNGMTTASISDLPAGFYSVTVTDSHGCERTEFYQITQPSRILVTIARTHITAYGLNDGKINLTVMGGTPFTGGIYQYEWTGPDGFTSGLSSLTNLAPGLYTVTVTDDNGCTVTEEIMLYQPDPSLILTCPDIAPLCANALVPARYASFTAFRNAGGRIEFNCSNGINEASFAMVSETSRGSCPRIVTRIYQIADNCGNTTFCEQIITFEDYQAPVVTRNIGPFTRQCYADMETLFPRITSIRSFIQEWGGLVSDNCTDPLDHTIRWLGDERTTFNNCDEVVIRRYQISDQCGNSTITEVRYIFKDTTAPVVSGPAQLTVTCDLPLPYATIQEFISAGYSASDNCSLGSLELTKEEVLTAGCPKTVRRTYTIFDACGNSTQFVQTITVVDTEKPTIAAINPIIVDCSQGNVNTMIEDWLNSVTADDNCRIDRIENNFNTLPNRCGAPVTVTFTAYDACGNSTTATSTITIIDDEAPKFNPVTPLVVDCSVGNLQTRINTWLNSVTATDNCGTAKVTWDYTTLTSSCGTPQTVTFTATDNCGLTATLTSSITITDTRAPVIPVIQPLALDCSDNDLEGKIQAWLAAVTATDLCGVPKITHNYTGVTNYCGTPLTVTFVATDDCNNTASRTSTITITDNSKPVFEPITPLVVDCAAGNITTQINNWIASVKATDPCGTVTITNNFNGVTGQCGAPVSVTFTATDRCGNTTTATSSITVIDNTAPTWTVLPPHLTVDCAAGNINTQVTNWLNSARAIDNCGVATVTHDFVSLENSCGSPLTVTFIATDLCGNSRPLVRTITVVDNDPPRFLVINPLEIDCAAGSINDQITAWLASVQATDNCGTARVTNDFVSLANLCGTPLTVTFTATDACGLTATTSSTITVTDNDPPKFADIPLLITDCFTADPADQVQKWLDDVTASDNCGSVTITSNYNPAWLNGPAEQSVTVTFTATDACGNTATAAGVFITPGRSVASISIKASQETICDATEVTFTATYENGGNNPAFRWYVNGTVVPGVTGPVYSYYPAHLDQVYAELISDDPCVENKTVASNRITITVTTGLTPEVTIAANPDTVCQGTPVTVTATPLNGGSNPVYRWFVNGVVRPGQTTNRLTYIPANQDEVYAELTSNDACVTNPVAISNKVIITVDPKLTVSVTITPEVVDICAGVQVTFTATALNAGPNPTWKWYVNGTQVTGANSATLTYQPADGDQIRAEVTSSEVCVVAPVTLSAPARVTHSMIDPVALQCPPNAMMECLRDVPPALTLNDFISNGWITNPQNIAQGSFRIDSTRTQTSNRIFVSRKYSITDICGREVSCTHTIELTDIIPPIVDCNENITVYVDENGQYTVTRDDVLNDASDNCTAYEDLEIIAVPPVLTCDDIGKTIAVLITVIDEAGNKGYCTTNITVLDTIKPMANCLDTVIYLNRRGQASIDVSMINNGSTDNCAIRDMWLDKTDFNCNDVGVNVVRLYVRDTSGNIDWCEARVTVKDTLAPVAICKAIDVNIGEDGYVVLTPTMVDNGSSDNCGVPQFTLSKTYFSCDDVGTHIVTLYVTDRYGNIDSCQAIITVIGNEPPVARDDNVKALAGQNTMILVTLNDTDDKGLDPESLSIVTPPEHGSLIMVNGTFVYRPFGDYIGSDTFTYSICDNGKYCEVLCDTAVVRITVITDNLPPVAHDQRYKLGCLAISGNILQKDYDPDGDNIFLNTNLIRYPQFGTLDLSANGSFFYVSNTGFVGNDILVYEICDDGFPVKCDTATVTFEVFQDLDCDGKPDEDKIFFIPEGFSPNGDGVHDLFQIVGMEDFPDAKMYIFNRWGNKLYEKEHYGNVSYWGSPEEAWWDGRSESRWNVGGGRVPVGNYLYILELGNGKVFKGTVMVSY
jgi:gliding motility-associated-like protein